MTTLLAQLAVPGDIGRLVIIAIIVIAVVGIGYVAAQAAGITIPPWVARIGWIVVVAIVAIVAIKFLLSLF